MKKVWLSWQWGRWWIDLVGLYEPRDLWIGLYWDKAYFHPDSSYYGYHVYLCLIPCFPLRFDLSAKRETS